LVVIGVTHPGTHSGDRGAGDRVVATDDSSDYPAEAKDLQDVVTFGAPAICRDRGRVPSNAKTRTAAVRQAANKTSRPN